MLPRIVLVRPRNPNNIGAVARAMNNFGFKELVVVAPHPPVWEEVITSAVGSEGVVASARVVASVRDAASDCSFVVGTVDQRREAGQTPRALVEGGSWQSQRSGILFGSEKTGLSNEDLSYCNAVVSVPTSEECPSMNLAQAAAVICYEFAQSSVVVGNSEKAGVTVSEIDLVLDRMRQALSISGFLTGANEERMLMEIRGSMMRFGLTRRELSIWLGALRRICHSLRK